MNRPAVESGFHNPTPLVQLTGHVNKATVLVEGVETMPLVDTWFQISALTEGFCSEFGIQGIHRG